MEGTEKEPEEWIEKYRAAVEAGSKKRPYPPGLGSFLDGVRSHFQVVFRGARARFGKSSSPLEPSKHEATAAASTPQPPVGDGQTQPGVPAEPESRKAS
jgi:hypothetical protein